MHQHLRLLIRDRAITNEVAEMRIGVPRRHALGANDFADHRREATHVFITRHRPRPDAAGTMTGDALFLQQWCDLIDIGNFCVLGFSLALGEIDNATDCFGFFNRNGFIRENGAERVGQIAILRLRLLRAKRKTIIDRPAISKLPRARIDYENIGGACNTQSFADQLRLIAQDRQIDAEFGGFLRERRAIILCVRIDHQKFDALLRKIFAQCVQRW